MKQSINEIGNTSQGMYALGQVAGRAYDRMFNGTKQSVGDGVVALNPKYGKVAQDAAYAAAGGYMDWRKRFKEQNGREPSDEEYRAWMQNYKNGCYDYGKPESEKRGIVKISESQLRNMIAESVKKVISELDWKTTSNASYKQSLGGYAKGDDGNAVFKRNFARKGGIDRYFKFRDYTDNAANRKFFGQEGGVDFLPNDNASQPNWVGFWCGHPTVRVYQGETQIGDIEPSCLWRARGFNFETMCIFDKFINGGESTIASPITPEEIFGDEIKLYQRFMEAVQEYTDLKSNKYTYDNEKGWHLKESNNNQYICHKKVRLTENELRGVIRKVIEEAVDESGYLQGAHKATLDNLNRKKDMGVTHTIRPKGGKGGTPISIPNSERLTPLDTHNEDMNRDFFEQYGKGEQIIIPFSVELNNSFIYNFDFVLKQIENIDNRYMSIIGDMTVTKTIGNPKSFMNAYCPRITSDVVLKYDFGAGILKFTRNPKGLAIRPAQNSDGTNNNRWNELILYANDYNKGKQRYSRL